MNHGNLCSFVNHTIIYQTRATSANNKTKANKSLDNLFYSSLGVIREK